MTETFPDYVAVDYRQGVGETNASYPTLAGKIQKAREVIETGLEHHRNPAVLWTGGKDSTLMLYILHRTVECSDYDMPTVIFPDHLQHPARLQSFVRRWADQWGMQLVVARNDSVRSIVRQENKKRGDELAVSELTDPSRWHVRDVLGHTEPTFSFQLADPVCRYLLTTFPLNNVMENDRIDGVISGVRWEDYPEETFVSPSHRPGLYRPQNRIHPLLQFTDRDVWDAFFTCVVPTAVECYPAGHVPEHADDLPEGVAHESVPIARGYFEGPTPAR